MLQCVADRLVTAIPAVAAAPLLQCVAVCCSVLQCVAVRCSVLQCVAVCCTTVNKFQIFKEQAINVKMRCVE